MYSAYVNVEVRKNTSRRKRKTIENNKEQPLKQHAEPVYRRMPTVTLKLFSVLYVNYAPFWQFFGETDMMRERKMRVREKLFVKAEVRRMQVMFKNVCNSFGRWCVCCCFRHEQCIWGSNWRKSPLHIYKYLHTSVSNVYLLLKM